MIIDRSWDGMSARTLDAVYCYGFSAHPSIPFDPSDFTRCYNWSVIHFGNDRIAFMKFLERVVSVHPMWKPIADNWVELERLYLEETLNETKFAKAPKLYAFMEEITKGVVV